MRSFIKRLFLFYVLGTLVLQIYAQQKGKVEILGANSFEYLKTGNTNISKLIGNVRLKQEDTYMNCDSALIYDKENLVEAFSNVSIKYRDSVTITGQYLKYDGNTKKALIERQVTLQDNSMLLTTERLDYDLASQYGYYGNGATIVSKENKLTSKIGYFYARNNEFFFKKQVVLVNPEYVMTADTLLYNTKSKIAYFFGSTNIKGKNDRIYCENGWYNTDRDQSQFSENAVLFSDRKMLQADSLYYDRKLQLGKAFRNIHVYDSVQQLHLYGQLGYTNELSGITLVTRKSKAIKLMEKGDSLFLYADTLMLLQRNRKQKEMIKAFHGVKVISKDLQAVCDSLVYMRDDSAMWMYKAPVMWNGVNQIFADTICFFINRGQLDSFNLLNSAMIISKVKGAHFDQIAGKNMHGTLDSNQIKLVKVLGNAQSIHYEKEDSINFIGVNVIDCSFMTFIFEKGQIKKTIFETSPTATMHPPKGLKPEEFRLKGFKWHEKRRPQRANFQY
jgi:lipopolysaccharide export system protein LptA